MLATLFCRQNTHNIVKDKNSGRLLAPLGSGWWIYSPLQFLFHSQFDPMSKEHIIWQRTTLITEPWQRLAQYHNSLINKQSQESVGITRLSFQERKLLITSLWHFYLPTKSFSLTALQLKANTLHRQQVDQSVANHPLKQKSREDSTFAQRPFYIGSPNRYPKPPFILTFKTIAPIPYTS